MSDGWASKPASRHPGIRGRRDGRRKPDSPALTELRGFRQGGRDRCGFSLGLLYGRRHRTTVSPPFRTVGLRWMVARRRWWPDGKYGQRVVVTRFSFRALQLEPVTCTYTFLIWPPQSTQYALP